MLTSNFQVETFVVVLAQLGQSHLPTDWLTMLPLPAICTNTTLRQCTLQINHHSFRFRWHQQSTQVGTSRGGHGSGTLCQEEGLGGPPAPVATEAGANSACHLERPAACSLGITRQAFPGAALDTAWSGSPAVMAHAREQLRSNVASTTSAPFQVWCNPGVSTGATAGMIS